MPDLGEEAHARGRKGVVRGELDLRLEVAALIEGAWRAEDGHRPLVQVLNIADVCRCWLVNITTHPLVRLDDEALDWLLQQPLQLHLEGP